MNEYVMVTLAAAALSAGCSEQEPRSRAYVQPEWLGAALFFDTSLSTPDGQSCAAAESYGKSSGCRRCANLNTTELGQLGLSAAQEDAIVSFLETLTDADTPFTPHGP